MSKFNRTRVAIAGFAVAALSALSTAHAGAVEPLTRAQVVAALDASRASGELAALNSEDGGAFWMSRQIPGLATPSAADCGGLDCVVLYAEDSGSFALSKAPQSSGLRRAEVNAQVLAARAQGVLGLLTAEDGGSMSMNRLLAVEPVRHAGQDVRPDHDSADVRQSGGA
jgi:hypothetical protein